MGNASSYPQMMRKWGAYMRARNRFVHIKYIRKHKGYDVMSLTTLTLEIRNDFDDPIKNDAMREAVRIAARDLIATAMLLQERQVPEVTLYENTMEGSAEVDLFAEETVDA